MKRFTETEKWRDCWFRQLPPILKLGYLFVLDHCNAAGVWDPDYALGDFHVGERVDWDDLAKRMGDERLHKMSNGRWHLLKFVSFQWGTLSPECKQHKHVLKLIEEQGLGQRKNGKRVGARVGARVVPTVVSNLASRPKEQEQEQEQEQDQGIGGAGGKGDDTTPQPKPPATIEDVYNAYPRKVAKQDAIKAIERAAERIFAEKLTRPYLETASALDWLLCRVSAFADAVAKWPAGEEQYVPHPATWFNRGRYDDEDKNWIKTAPTVGGKAPVTSEFSGAF
jgi:hypothetical protein